MITTTLNRIRTHGPCADGWTKLLTGLGKTAPDDELLPFARIVETNGLPDALWCLRAEPQYDREWRLFAVWCARQVQHLMTDPRSIAALDVAERYAHGQTTEAELAAARAAARAASGDAARLAYAAAGDAARAAARAAEGAAAREAAGAAAGAAAWDDAWEAAYAAAGAAAGAAAQAAQTAEFLRIVTETEART